MKHAVFSPALTVNLLRDLRRANTEAAKKERVIQYVTITFAGDDAAQQLISDIALGAERTISNIPRGKAIGRGRADTQTETVIIEWEKDLSKTGEHAKEQLEEYLVGNWRSGQTYRYILITTDGVRWRRYAPDWASLPAEGKKLKSVNLRQVEAFDLTETTTAEFPFFLDTLLFGNQTRPATLARIQADFGDTSAVFINSLSTLSSVATDIETNSELKVAFEQWQRFLSLAYGEFDSSPRMFLVHTYLSTFAKFIAHAVVTGRSVPDEGTMLAVLNGEAFRSMNIERFVEDDFFHWVHADTYFDRLKPAFREISRRIQEFDFTNVAEDILKGVYQELIDLDTRHALGEYYTPDWLCQKVVASLDFTAGSRVLDPACGSGSFLRAAVARLREIDPDAAAEKLASQVAGIDIHPLSVQISKTTMLLAFGDRIRAAKKPVILQIFLANSLLVPRGSANLFETSFEVSVDNKQHVLDIAGIKGGDAFDNLISLCDDLVERHDTTLERRRFISLIARSIPKGTAESLPGQLYNIYASMKVAKDAGRDSIWKFILQNSYKPVFLMHRFDIVVGNPPWLTYAAIGSAEYQRLLRTLATTYGVTPSSTNMPHLEIAAIFLAHSANYFLSGAGGTLAFVLPRSFMTADHHHNTRAGQIKGLRINRIWDLQDVKPLFRVPSCVLFAVPDSSAGTRALPAAGVAGLSVSGKLPSHHLDFIKAAPLLTDTQQRWFFSTLTGEKVKRVRSAFTRTLIEGQKGGNAYSRFRQGATIVPRNLYFIDVDQELPEDASLIDRTIAARSSETANAEAKAPWKGKSVSGRIEGSLLYRTAISRNVLPFCLVDPPLIALPVHVEGGKGDRTFALATSDDLFSAGHTEGSEWFDKSSKIFDRYRTEAYKKTGMTMLKRLDYQRGVTSQNPDGRFLVLYTSSATDASAVLIDRRDFDLPFIVDHKTYWCEVKSTAEGHYVASFLNSGFANQAIKDFQSKGLFGERDIHKLIVMLPLPAFQKNDERHQRISSLGKASAAIARQKAKAEGWEALDARKLGRVRTRLRELLEDELVEIDQLLREINGQKAAAIAVRRAKKQMGAGPLFDH